jgi:hypothetical protein
MRKYPTKNSKNQEISHVQKIKIIINRKNTHDFQN